MLLNLRIISDMMSNDREKGGTIHEDTIFDIRTGTGYYKDI